MAGLRSSSGKDRSEVPDSCHELKPSPEVAAKMRPLARASFERVLNRVARPIQRRAAKRK